MEKNVSSMHLAAVCSTRDMKSETGWKPGKALDGLKGEHGSVEVCTEIPGVLRGIIQDGFFVTEHFKTADVDPRKEYCGILCPDFR